MESTVINIGAAAPATVAALFDRKPLVAALTFLAGSIVEARNTKPILSNVRIDACESGALIAGTDLDIYASTTVAAAWDAPGTFTACARALLAAVKASDGDTVRLEYADGALSVTGDTMASRVPTLPSDDFPMMPPLGDKRTKFTLPADQFAADLARVRPAISTEETRYYLNGIFFHAPLGGTYKEPEPATHLIMAATDGHRLARITRDAPAFEGEAMRDAIVPRKALGCVAKLLGKKPTGDVALLFAGAGSAVSRVVFTLDGWTIDSKLIDGTFPDYGRVIPSQNECEAEFDGPAMALCVANVIKVAANERTRAIKLEFGADGAKLSCTNAEGGRAAAGVAASFRDTAKREPRSSLTIGVNGAYLKTALDAFGAGDVILRMADAATPMLFESTASPEFIVVLMPMRVDGGTSAPKTSKAAAPVAPVAPVASLYDTFEAAYSAAFVARDRDGIRAAIDAYRIGLTDTQHSSASMTDSQEHYQVAMICAQLRTSASDDVRLHRRDAKRIRRASRCDRMRYAPTNGSFAKLARRFAARQEREADTRAALEAGRAALAALDGYSADDTRDVLPIVDSAGKRTFILRAELARGLGGFMRIVKADGSYTRRYSSITIDQIARVIRPRGAKAATAAATIDTGAIEALQAQVTALAAQVTAMQAQPAAATVATPVAVYGPPCPALAPRKRERSETERRAILRAWRMRGELRRERRSAAYSHLCHTQEMARADRYSGAYGKLIEKRPRTAALLIFTRAKARTARRELIGAETGLRIAQAELARLQPLAAALQGLMTPAAAPVVTGGNVVSIAA